MSRRERRNLPPITGNSTILLPPGLWPGSIFSVSCVCPWSRVGGAFLAMKGAAAQEELDEAKGAIAKLGGKLERVYEYTVGDAVHRVVIIRKVKNTPKQYPRRYAKIKQQPL